MKEIFLKLISQKLIIRVGLILFTIILSSIFVYNYINRNLYKSKASYPCGMNAYGQCSGDCPAGKVCTQVLNGCSCLSIAPTKTPTPTLTKTPTPTLTITPPINLTLTLPPICQKSQGDANCDGKIDLIDFEIWRKEFVGESNTKNADFNGDDKVSLADFEIWRRNNQFVYPTPTPPPFQP